MADLEAEIATLAGLEIGQLRIEWRKLYRGSPAARLSRDLMVRAIAYRMQERAQGGLGGATRRRLRALAQELEATGSGEFGPGITLKPGATIVGEWRGSAYSVLVLEDGFEYAGIRYRSLSQIASLITGTHWSGPRFFSLGARPSRGGRP